MHAQRTHSAYQHKESVKQALGFQLEWPNFYLSKLKFTFKDHSVIQSNLHFTLEFTTGYAQSLCNVMEAR